MAFMSSSPVASDFASRRVPTHRLHGTLLTVPSSPSASYHDGELSPTLDSSFASSMSLSSDAPPSATVERTGSGSSRRSAETRPLEQSRSQQQAGGKAAAPPTLTFAPRASGSIREGSPHADDPHGRHLVSEESSSSSTASSFAARLSDNKNNNENVPYGHRRIVEKGRIIQQFSAIDPASSARPLSSRSAASAPSVLSSPAAPEPEFSAMDISPAAAPFVAYAGAAAASSRPASPAFPFLAPASKVVPPSFMRTESNSSAASSSSSSTSTSTSSTTTTKASEVLTSGLPSDFPYLKNLLFRQPRPSISTASSSSSTTSLADVSASYGAWFVPPPAKPFGVNSNPAAAALIPTTAPLSIRPRRSPENSSPQPPAKHYATVPPSNAEKLLPPFQHFHIDEQAFDDDEGDDDEQGPMAPPPRPNSVKRRGGLPSDWAQAIARPASASGGLRPPPHPSPVKRASDPNLSSHRVFDAESSPSRMDIDGTSPATSPVALLRPRNHPRSVSDSAGRKPCIAGRDENSPPRLDIEVVTSDSGASSRLGDLFADDLSPIPPSRKRFLSDEREFSPDPTSPTPAICGPTNLFGTAPTRRPFEKAMSTTAVPLHVARRQRSSANLGLKKRPSLVTFATIGAAPPGPASAGIEQSAPFAVAAAGFKRHAASSINGKPKPMRRAFSVADAAVQILQNPKALDPSYRASIATEMDAFANVNRLAAPTGANLCSAGSALSIRAKAMQESGSPVTGFRSQEAKGKVLPCFGVKQDGLMRITPTTLNDLQAGVFSSRIKQYVIIDCRFDYEYEGGHIRDAVNIPEVADVERTLLHDRPPEPSTSEQAPFEGKTVLIFHCEFSAKRAPTTAQHLRKQDRLKNHHDYPNIHYPEVYVLQGGYAEFFRCYPERCIGGYLAMDDPEHIAKRSTQLNNFRQQKRHFQRANTFTFGQAQHASTLLQAATTRAPLQPSQSHNVRGSFDEKFSFPAAKQPMLVVPLSTDRKNSLKATPTGTKGSMMACHEDELEADSSFGTNSGSSPSGAGDSPCPGGKFVRHSLPTGRKPMGELAPPFRPGVSKQLFALGGGGSGRRTFERAQTSAALMFKR